MSPRMFTRTFRRAEDLNVTRHRAPMPERTASDVVAVGRQKFWRKRREDALSAADAPPKPQFRTLGDGNRKSRRQVTLPKLNLPPLSQED